MTAQAPASAPAWHTLSVEDALKAQGVDPQVGLSAAEVERRRAQYGPNKFAEAKKESGWSKFGDRTRLGCVAGPPAAGA